MSHASNPDLTPFQRTWVLSHQTKHHWSFKGGLFAFLMLLLLGTASIGLLTWDFYPDLISPQFGSAIKFLILCLFVTKSLLVFLLCLAAFPILGVTTWALASIRTAEGHPLIQNKNNPGLVVFAKWYKTQSTSIKSFSIVRFLHNWMVRLFDVGILLGLIFGGHYIMGFLWLLIIVPAHAVAVLCYRSQLNFIKSLTPERVAIADKLNEPVREDEDEFESRYLVTADRIAGGE